ncbi:unnamed protein product [Meganyctiphanes norvegica]|uniref:Glutathione S-transferase n=1 Tax=Meganyctiphanes norvegica TaxID=48144 RepID=A0AAV2QKM0_MEGNR
MAPTLAYWDIRGLAQPIRLLLGYTGTQFVDKTYAVGPPPDHDKSDWLNVKFTLGLDFPNLPYFIDGDIKITQSNAIIRHIGRINNMDGKTEAEKVRVDIMENTLMDFRNGWVRLCYGDFDGGKADYIKKLPDTMKQFNKFIGKNKWLAGNTLTFPDFILFELLDHHQHLVPDLLKDHSNLSNFMDNFRQLEKIKAFMASPNYKKRPLHGKIAKYENSL